MDIRFKNFYLNLLHQYNFLLQDVTMHIMTVATMPNYTCIHICIVPHIIIIALDLYRKFNNVKINDIQNTEKGNTSPVCIFYTSNWGIASAFKTILTKTSFQLCQQLDCNLLVSFLEQSLTPSMKVYLFLSHYPVLRAKHSSFPFSTNWVSSPLTFEELKSAIPAGYQARTIGFERDHKCIP